MTIFQVTIPPGGKAQISAFLPSNVPVNTFAQTLIIQNNASHVLRVGDTTVSATKGIAVAATTGIETFGSFMNYNIMLSDVWIFGTAGDVVDILYIN